MNGMSRQLGRFRVSGLFYRGMQAGDGAWLFKDMVVLLASHQLDTDEIEYLAIHPDFKPVPHGHVIPFYRAAFDAGSAVAKWV